MLTKGKLSVIIIFADDKTANRSVAQLGRALRSGRRGRRFKSCRFDSLAGAPESFIQRVPVLFLLLPLPDENIPLWSVH